MVSGIELIQQRKTPALMRLAARPPKVTSVAQLGRIIAKRFYPECRLFANRFAIRQILGLGGHGIVYRAFDFDTAKEVALKICKDSCIGFLIEEALVTEDISTPPDPHLPQFVAAGIGELTDGHETFFLATEYIDGHSLYAEIYSRKMPLDRVLQIASQVCCGLWAAGKKGHIHRDLRPENVLIANADDRAIVIDFGFSASRLRISTLEYKAPEQSYLDAEELDSRTDIYALGLTINNILTQAKTPNIPDPVRAIIDRATMRNRENRFQSWEEMYNEIERIRAELATVEEGVEDLTAIYCEIGPVVEDAVAA